MFIVTLIRAVNALDTQVNTSLEVSASFLQAGTLLLSAQRAAQRRKPLVTRGIFFGRLQPFSVIY